MFTGFMFAIGAVIALGLIALIFAALVSDTPGMGVGLIVALIVAGFVLHGCSQDAEAEPSPSLAAASAD